MPNKIDAIQSILGVSPDGIFGPKSQAALNRVIGETTYEHATVLDLQRLLSVEGTSRWDIKSQRALDAALGKSDWFTCDASSFADPADVRAFKRCKLTGKSDLQCFSIGDNGIGQFGKITAQNKVPMVAIHKTAMVARWGSVLAAAHRPVAVVVNHQTVEATIEDRISAPGRIDLNPACALELGLTPPFVVAARWKWA